MNTLWKDWRWSSNTLVTWCEQLTHWKRPWSWERVKAEEEGDTRWDSWMASLIQWTWTWANSGRYREAWCAAVHGVTNRHDLVTKQQTTRGTRKTREARRHFLYLLPQACSKLQVSPWILCQKCNKGQRRSLYNAKGVNLTKEYNICIYFAPKKHRHTQIYKVSIDRPEGERDKHI